MGSLQRRNKKKKLKLGLTEDSKKALERLAATGQKAKPATGYLEPVKSSYSPRSETRRNNSYVPSDYIFLRIEINNKPAQAGVKWQQGNAKDRAVLESRGVDTDLFTEAKVQANAQGFVDETLSAASVYGVKIGDAVPLIVFEPLTKTGKLPKNVVQASLTIEETEIYDAGYGFESRWTGDVVICYIGYLADGDINMIDYHFWKNHIRHGVKVRNISGTLLITEIVKHTTDRDRRSVLYKVGRPENNDQASLLFNRSIKRTYG